MTKERVPLPAACAGAMPMSQAIATAIAATTSVVRWRRSSRKHTEVTIVRLREGALHWIGGPYGTRGATAALAEKGSWLRRNRPDLYTVLSRQCGRGRSGSF